MGVRQFSWSLETMNGEAIDLDGEVARVPAQRLQLHAATGGVFEDADDLLPHKIGKVRGRSIEQEAGNNQNQQQHKAAAHPPDIAPEAYAACDRGLGSSKG